MKDISRAEKPLELVLKDNAMAGMAVNSAPTVVWACGKCRLARISQEAAIECCAPTLCEMCKEDLFPPTSVYCSTCQNKRQEEKEQARYDKAQKVEYSQYQGQMLFCSHCDKYFWDLDEFIDEHIQDTDPEISEEDALTQVPTWAWGTEDKTLKLDAERILSDAMEMQDLTTDDDDYDRIREDAIKEMQGFFDAWLLSNNRKVYFQDTTIVVDLKKEIQKYIGDITKSTEEAKALTS